MRREDGGGGRNGLWSYNDIDTVTRLSYSLNMEHYLKVLVVCVSSISGLVGAYDDI